MILSDFDFELPSELIATHPLADRDASRMLVVGDHGGTLADKHIRDIVSYIRPGDVIVFNNSRVIPARFNATTADGKVYELTLHTSADDGDGKLWWALAKKFGQLKIGDTLVLDDNKTKIIVRDKNDNSGLMVEFSELGENSVFDILDTIGKMPLPPYMKRAAESDDRNRYQTVYASPLGSMAAPTAGLHFTPELIAAIENAGGTIVNITLHVGSGTWAPVKSENLSEHKMHSEWGCITESQADIINNASRVIAVGTTSLRLLESAATKSANTRISPFCGTTDIFITPGYKFSTTDVLLTNFHLPKSTLLMLVSAFAGMSEMRAAYAHAIVEKYRFFSYGDCCLLFKKD